MKRTRSHYLPLNRLGNTSMNHYRLAFPLLVCGFLLSPAISHAEPGGCIKGGMAGGVAGHFVGSGHAKRGAAAGCAAGMVRRHNARKAAAAQKNQEETQPQPAAPDAGAAPESR
ncbi:hypothetical protein [Gluconacetobacter entanii]|uniref:hypothetical protein n=1 Tax=Gluconacetobacter entanii TaxID=108528 RepID=UPI001FC97814|nr:hypothetical protein [Gluconacetobacter entanii]